MSLRVKIETMGPLKQLLCEDWVINDCALLL